MPERTISIDFRGMWPGYSLGDFQRHHPYLLPHFRFAQSERPELVVVSVFDDPRPIPAGSRTLFFTGENVQPDMGRYDWAISFCHLDHPRHLRVPLWAWTLRAISKVQGMPATLERLVRQPDEQSGLDRPEFCNFIYRNNVPWRNAFFQRLNAYRPVTAPSRAMNNAPPIGTRPWDKHDFQRRFKFTIAMENTSTPGYCTEKIMDAMLARTVPIYYGDPLVHLDFNPRSMINRHDFSSDEEFIGHIIEVDRSPELYERYFREPYFHHNAPPAHLGDAVCLEFFRRVLAF